MTHDARHTRTRTRTRGTRRTTHARTRAQALLREAAPRLKREFDKLVVGKPGPKGQRGAASLGMDALLNDLGGRCLVKDLTLRPAARVTGVVLPEV